MGAIIQTYAWSNSRVQTLRSCPWKYFSTYFAAWEGWLPSAPQHKQRAYMLKNITNLPMFIGSVVHNIIEDIIKTARTTGEWRTLEKAQHDGIQALRKGWKQSKEKRWQASPKKNINLAEHFFQEEIDPEKLAQFKQKVLKCLKAFYDMPLFEIMRNLKPEDWLTIEDFAEFELSTGEKVTVKIDTGFRFDGKVYLLDYKSGKVSDNVLEQLITYGMYAIKQKWCDKPEDIVIIPAYLASFAEIGEKAMPHLKVTMYHMRRQANTIRSEYPMLTEAFANKDNPDYFKKTDNERACANCFFRGDCSGAKTEVEDGETPF